MLTAAEYLNKFKVIVDSTDLIKVNGKVADVIGLIITSVGPNVSLGEVCQIRDKQGNEICTAEVVGFKQGKVLSIALENVRCPVCQIPWKETGLKFLYKQGLGLLMVFLLLVRARELEFLRAQVSVKVLLLE